MAKKKRVKKFGTEDKPMSFSEDKVVIVTDSRGKTRKTKVKRKGEKYKDKMDKYGNLKKRVTWKDGKRTVVKPKKEKRKAERKVRRDRRKTEKAKIKPTQWNRDTPLPKSDW